MAIAFEEFGILLDAGYPPLPRFLAHVPGRSRLAGMGRGLPVRVGCGGGWAAAGWEVGQGPAGGVEAVAGLQAAYRLRLADVQAVRGDGGGHDPFAQARFAAAASEDEDEDEDEGEVAAGFGEQVPAVEAAAAVHARLSVDTPHSSAMRPSCIRNIEGKGCSSTLAGMRCRVVRTAALPVSTIRPLLGPLPAARGPCRSSSPAVRRIRGRLRSGLRPPGAPHA